MVERAAIAGMGRAFLHIGQGEAKGCDLRGAHRGSPFDVGDWLTVHPAYKEHAYKRLIWLTLSNAQRQTVYFWAWVISAYRWAPAMGAHWPC